MRYSLLHTWNIAYLCDLLLYDIDLYTNFRLNIHEIMRNIIAYLFPFACIVFFHNSAIEISRRM